MTAGPAADTDLGERDNVSQDTGRRTEKPFRERRTTSVPKGRRTEPGMTESGSNTISKPNRVLMVGNSALQDTSFAKALEALGCQVYLSSPSTPEELEQLLDLLNPSVLVLADIFGGDLLSTFRRIKTPPHRALLPVIIVSSGNDSRLDLLQAGVESVLEPPWDANELKALVNGILERVEVVRHHTELDELTGALTGPAAAARLDYEVSRTRRYGTPGGYALIDLDNYDRVRSAVGELAADAGLRRFAQIVRHELRETDLLGRVSGDRFCAIMPGTDLTGGVKAMRRILAVIGSATVEVPGGQRITLAASAGVGEFAGEGSEQVVRRVSVAINRAKAAGGGTLFTA